MGMVRLVLARECTEAPRFEEREGGRWCTHCASMQHDLRDATRSEAIALMRAHGGRACARVRLGRDGAPKFVPERPARGVSALGAALAMTLAACESPPEPSVTPVAVETPPPATPVPPSVVAAPQTTTAPPTPDAPPPTTDAAIDHSTDASPELAHHQQHRHRHAPVPHEGGEWDGAIGLDGL